MTELVLRVDLRSQEEAAVIRKPKFRCEDSEGRRSEDIDWRLRGLSEADRFPNMSSSNHNYL